MRALLILTGLVVGCAPAAEQDSGSTPRLTRDRAIESVKRILKDPYSARFGDVKVDGAFVCGLVNSKNTFGAYEGNKRFFVSEKTRLVWLEGMGEEASVIGLWSICHSGGIAP
jgi:hypothetical protein